MFNKVLSPPEEPVLGEFAAEQGGRGELLALRLQLGLPIVALAFLQVDEEDGALPLGILVLLQEPALLLSRRWISDGDDAPEWVGLGVHGALLLRRGEVDDHPLLQGWQSRWTALKYLSLEVFPSSILPHFLTDLMGCRILTLDCMDNG